MIKIKCLSNMTAVAVEGFPVVRLSDTVAQAIVNGTLRESSIKKEVKNAIALGLVEPDFDDYDVAIIG